MGGPYTHGSLDREQGWPEGLVIQIQGVKMRRPCTSQTGTVSESDRHCVRTVCALDAHHARTRHMLVVELVQIESDVYFGIYVIII